MLNLYFIILDLKRQETKDSPKILIVDDQMFLAETLQMILEDLGVSSDIAIGGGQAINMV